MTVLLLPTVPNSPLASEAGEMTLGPMMLRRNTQIDFVENGAFDPSLAVYDDNYQNSQAHSPQFKSHMSEVLALLKRSFPRGGRLIEVGCGKGDFFELISGDAHFDAAGFDATYEGSNSRIQKRYLTETDALQADIVVLRHVLEHVQKPHLLLELLNGIFGASMIYIEVPSYEWIVREQAFFDITYEHVNYFSKNALLNLFNGDVQASGLLFDGQYQFAMANLGRVSGAFGKAYDSQAWEALGFDALFPRLSDKISEIEQAAHDRKNIYIWGAATKGCMFLVHCVRQGRLMNKVSFAVDLNPNKWNKYLPVSHIPIRNKHDFFQCADENDLLVISNPNYKTEICAELRSNGLRDLRVVTL